MQRCMKLYKNLPFKETSIVWLFAVLINKNINCLKQPTILKYVNHKSSGGTLNAI